MKALLFDYDLLKFIDTTHPYPPTTITENNATTPNPAYHTWLRQYKLIFSTLVGSLTPALILIIQQANTSREAWTILANTYACTSRGHIKQIKEQIKHAIKGS